MEILEYKSPEGNEITSVKVEIPLRFEFYGTAQKSRNLERMQDVLRCKTSNLFEIVQILGMAQNENEKYDYAFCLELLGILGQGFQEAIELINMEVIRDAQN